MSGITYPITQVSVSVRDLEAEDEAPITRRSAGDRGRSSRPTARSSCTTASGKGKPADFNVRWAETMVGDLNFELIEPLGRAIPGRSSSTSKGEGISSIAVMFDTPRGIGAGQGAVRRRRHRRHGVGHIGDDIEWYFLDTELPVQVRHRVRQRPRPRFLRASRDLAVMSTSTHQPPAVVILSDSEESRLSHQEIGCRTKCVLRQLDGSARTAAVHRGRKPQRAGRRP